MKKATVYLSGPMTGLPDLNYKTFNSAASALGLLGYSVINPASFGTETKGMTEPEAWRACLQAGIKVLVDCDAIVMLPGWPKSLSATIERSIAIDLSMRVMTLIEAVLEHAVVQQEAVGVVA